MSSVIRSAIISDSAFLISKEDRDSFVEKTPVIEGEENQNDLMDSNLDEPVIVCDEKELKLLEYARALEEAETKIESLEETNLSLINDIDDLRSSAHKDGYKSGYNKGLEEGRGEAKNELIEQMQVIDKITISYKNEMEKLISLSEEALVETVFVGVGKIIGNKVREPNGWSEIIIQTMKDMDHASHLQVRVSPEDYDFLSNLSDLNTEIESKMKTKIVADEHVSIGGCILEHDGGTLDARLEIQLHRLNEALLGVREQRKLDMDSR